MRKPKVGDRVRITQCSGVDSGKEGVVINPMFVKKDGRGIPQLEGEYRPWDRKRASRESFVRLDYRDRFTPERGWWKESPGPVISMFNNRLEVLPYDPLRAALAQADAMTDMDRFLKGGAR